MSSPGVEMRSVVVLLLVAGCGNLQPDSPDSKLNSAPGNNANSNTNAVTLNNTVPGNNVAGADWGTEGPADNNPKSPAGGALCRLEDVETDDIGTTMSSEVPPDAWSSEVVLDAPGRCGDDEETLAWRLFNCERIGAGLTPLRCDMRMVWMGREHTLDMIAQDFFRHDNPAGESAFDRMDRHGVAWASGAENIVVDQDVLANHYSWMDSEFHRATILGNYTHAGVGTELDGGMLLSTAVYFTPQ